MIYDIIVIGAGPAGMTAAIKAKKSCKDAKILVIDRNKKPGKKLYATGNGKCNLANTKLDLSCYHSDNEFFPYQLVSTEAFREVTEFFLDLGVATYEDDGYLYPASLQASTIVWALTDRLKMQKIDVHTSEEVKAVTEDDGRYIVHTELNDYYAANVIVSPGGAAAPKLGGSEKVYDILKPLGVSIVSPHPALCRLKSRDVPDALAGVRAKANVSLMCDGNLYGGESGEVQFASGWISGIAVFNLSIQCIDLLNDGKKPYIEVELVPDMKEEALAGYMKTFARKNGARRPIAMLNGLVNEKIACEILERLGINCVSSAEFSDDDISRIANMLKHMEFAVDGHGSYEDSQAASGGVDTRQLRADTLELGGHKGLYVAGEYADVTGKCGGYNIMWAVISGMRAGTAAGKRMKNDKNK